MAQWVPTVYSMDAYFRMGAYTWEAVVCSGYGCLYSLSAYSLWVPIILSIWYIGNAQDTWEIFA